MKIDKIKKLTGNRYQITFSDKTKLITYDEVILKNNLLYKKELDPDELKIIEQENNYYSLYNESIKYLTKKMHSKLEYIKYLNKQDINKILKDKLLDDMTKLNLLNDDNYLKAYIYDKFHLTNDGPLKIKKELLNNNISLEKIEEELNKISDDEQKEKLKKLVNKRLKVTKGSNYQIKQKVLMYLINLGYEKKNIEEFLINIDDSSSLEKDFNKIYLSLKTKEKDEDKLYLKIKQKLYQKGYSLSKIDEIINKKRN